jgi:hypothetical protein
MVRINAMGQAWHMHVPAPLRAAVGLVATAADEARRLPDRALELPMLAISTALQASVRAQQRYACLTARGEALLNRTHPTDEPPAWATFDEPVGVDELRRAAEHAADRSAGHDRTDDDLTDDDLTDDDLTDDGTTAEVKPLRAPRKRAGTSRAPRKAPARKPRRSSPDTGS